MNILKKIGKGIWLVIKSIFKFIRWFFRGLGNSILSNADLRSKNINR